MGNPNATPRADGHHPLAEWTDEDYDAIWVALFNGAVAVNNSNYNRGLITRRYCSIPDNRKYSFLREVGRVGI